MLTATPTATTLSASWQTAEPHVTVVVSTHNRAALLSGLLEALDGGSEVAAEYVIVDNGSADGAWELLTTWAASTALPVLALRLDAHDGPGIPRNTAVARSRGEVLAFTDDDCLPTPGWLAALVAPFDDAAVTIVQGRTAPEPDAWAGPWSRSLDVSRPSGLFETANLACRHTAFDQVGGFAPQRLLSGRAFGEDVQLGSAIARSGEFRFAADALMHHRVLPGTYRDYLVERSRLGGFPALVKEIPELRRGFVGGVFLSRRTAATDAGVLGTVAAIAAAQPWSLVLTAPWLANCWRAARGRQGRPRAVRAGQIAAGDLVGLVSLVKGSAKARRLVL